MFALYLYSQAEHPNEEKRTLQIVFLAANLWRLFCVVCFGKGITQPVITTAVLILPLVIIFTCLGHILSRRVSAQTFRRVVYGFIGLIGIMHMLGLK